MANNENKNISIPSCDVAAGLFDCFCFGGPEVAVFLESISFDTCEGVRAPTDDGVVVFGEVVLLLEAVCVDPFFPTGGGDPDAMSWFCSISPSTTHSHTQKLVNNQPNVQASHLHFLQNH